MKQKGKKMTDKHTEGPWEAEGREVHGVSPYGQTLPNATGRVVIARPAPHGNEFAGESEANARLIAAAPDLLEALEGTLVLLEEDVADSEWACAGCEDEELILIAQKRLEKAVKAIAKAKEGQI